MEEWELLEQAYDREEVRDPVGGCCVCVCVCGCVAVWLCVFVCLCVYMHRDEVQLDACVRACTCVC